MSSTSTSAGALLCLVGLLMLSACDASTTTPTASSTESSTTPRAETTASPPAPSPTPTDDAGRAVAAVVAYWAAIDAAAANPSTKLEVLSSVARGQALAQWQTTLADYRAKGWRQTGRSELSAARSVVNSSSDFTVSICRDVTDVDVLDKSGRSVVKASRPDRQRFDYQVVKDSTAFFVSEDQLEGTPCAA